MRRVVLIALALSVALPSVAAAHAFSPLLLELNEQEDGRVDVLWKVAARFEGGQPALSADIADLSPELPARCSPIGTPVTRPGPAALTTRWRADCGPEGLGGGVIRVDGLETSSRDVLARVIRADGREQTAVLRSSGDQLAVEDGPSSNASSGRLETLVVYSKLGVEHIGGGLDHLLFVLGLVLLVGRRGRLIATVTAFTVAHSLTLALTVLGLLQLPSAPVEAAIAVSIALVALELARSPRTPPTLTRRAPWLVAGTFGLLHGFGFAGALVEVGLPAGEIPTALLGFNVGVELGQLIFVFFVLGALALGRRLTQNGSTRRWATLATAYAIGGLAMAWTIERVVGFWEVMG